MKDKRVDQKLSEEYKKDDRFEEVLSSLNNCLAIEEENILQNASNVYPTLHVLGVPRSGTTLATQLLSSHLPVGYINNLIAAFWKAPIYGIELSKKLLGKEYKSSFESAFGRTDNIREPHEFGYFWNHHLQYNDLQQKPQKQEDLINWQQLAKTLDNMTLSFEAPMVFKSFLFGFHAVKAVKEMPKTCFVYIKRDFLDNAFSILKLRRKLNGNEKEWGSIKPIQYKKLKDLSVYEQIAGQILCLEHEYLNQLEGVPEENKRIYEYEDLCQKPGMFLEEMRCLVSNHYKGKMENSFEIPPFSIRKSKRREKKEEELFLQARDKVQDLFNL